MWGNGLLLYVNCQQDGSVGHIAEEQGCRCLHSVGISSLDVGCTTRFNDLFPQPRFTYSFGAWRNMVMKTWDVVYSLRSMHPETKIDLLVLRISRVAADSQGDGGYEKSNNCEGTAAILRRLSLDGLTKRSCASESASELAMHNQPWNSLHLHDRQTRQC